MAQFSTSSQLGCLSCEDETSSMRLKHGYKQCYMGHRRFLPADHELRYDAKSFDGTEEHRSKPAACSGEADLDKIKSIRDFDKLKTWKGAGCLFCLSYWKYNLLRHNLDFMHIEKNVCKNKYRTLLEMEGKYHSYCNETKKYGPKFKPHKYLLWLPTTMMLWQLRYIAMIWPLMP
jgi:hypothetical protein